MTTAIKRWLRPVALPSLHIWQRFYDSIRAKFREYGIRRKSLRSNTIVVEDDYGTRFVLYPFDRPNLLYMLRHPCDVAEFQAIPSLVKVGDTAFDIGANIGIYSVLLSRLCGPTGRVWAFEPVLDTYWRLRETLALNRCENVIPVQSAVCEESGIVRMNLFERPFSEWNSLGTPTMKAPDGSPVSPYRSVEVPANSLDRFCDVERIERINFLKVDVEGFELSVFRGAERLLKERRVDYICFEVSKEPLKGAGIESRKIFEALQIHKYSAYRFDETAGKFNGPIDDTAESWTNFFASWKDLSKIDETRRIDSVRVDRLADAKESGDVVKVSSPMATPIITVLINAYNYGQFIEQAIDSVLSQQFPMDQVEILVIDDGSTDDTAERVKNYGSRIRYFYKPNGGQGSALNFGFRHASSEIIVLLDADDYFVPNKLQRIADEFQSHPDAGMIYHPRLELDTQTGQTQKSDFVAISGFLPDDLGKLRAYRYTSTSCLAFRREALGWILPMPESFRILADTYVASLIPAVAPVLAVDEALTVYRIHGQNLYTRTEPLTKEQKDQQAETIRIIAKEVRAWIMRHEREVKLPATRVYFAEWFQAMEENQFLLRPPGRFGFFFFLVRQNHAYSSEQTWKLTVYNYMAALSALLVDYEDRHLAYEWRGRTMRAFQSLLRKFRSAQTKMKAPDVKP